MDNVIIDVQNITKVYKLYDNLQDRLKESIHPFKKKYHKEFYALNNVSFQIKQGESIGIIGKNGAGKSTLLKIITGVLNPTNGSVKINGRVSALLELGAGFNPELSGIDNIYFNGMVMGYTKEEMENKIDEILAFADIGEHIYQPVKTYSSGMFVRLAFSVAVSVEPEILIVDEALAVGDVRFRQKAMRKMNELMENAKAILFVTHDMESIKNFCSDVIWIKDGNVFERGKPKDIVQRYYNYMLHDLLPSDKSNYETTTNKGINYEGNGLNELEWIVPTDCEIVGGHNIEFTRIAFYSSDYKHKLDVLEGNEQKVVFLAEINIYEDIEDPLLGFGVFNQYGVPIIHFNTSSIEGAKPTKLTAGETTLFSFEFDLPRLQNGTYSISLGMNDGTLDNNVVIQYIRECYIFKVQHVGVESRQYGQIIAENASIKKMK